LRKAGSDAALVGKPASIGWGLPRPGASRQASVTDIVRVELTARSIKKGKRDRDSQTTNVRQD